MSIIAVPTTMSDTAGGTMKLVYRIFPSLKPAFTSNANNKPVTVDTDKTKKKVLVVKKKAVSAVNNATDTATDAYNSAKSAVTGAGDNMKMILYVVLAVVIIKILKD